MLSNFVSLVLLTGVQFSGQACSQTPLAACAFGARNLPDPVLKSSNGPVTQSIFAKYWRAACP